MKLGKAYKSYLTALILRHEKNYQEAWHKVKDVDDESLIAFKIKLLYDMKKISHLIEYSNEGVDVLSLLNEEQKINLIGYLTARDHCNEAEKMVDITAAETKMFYIRLLKMKGNMSSSNIIGPTIKKIYLKKTMT